MSEYFDIKTNLLQDSYYLFKIYIDKTDLNQDTYQELRSMYVDAIEKHNNQIKNNPYANSGFDLFTPLETIIEKKEKINLNVKVACYKIILNSHYDTVVKEIPRAYYLYPRSSISKTPLRLSNSVGIIDAGYRGNLLAAVDNISNNSYTVEQFTRLFQITSPTLQPFLIKLSDKELDLGETERGSEGFGSTGV